MDVLKESLFDGVGPDVRSAREIIWWTFIVNTKVSTEM